MPPKRKNTDRRQLTADEKVALTALLAQHLSFESEGTSKGNFPMEEKLSNVVHGSTLLDLLLRCSLEVERLGFRVGLKPSCTWLSQL